LELLRHVAADYPTTRAIVLTGYGSIQSAVEATKLGADNYISKPIVIDEFLQAVRSTLQRGQPVRATPATTNEVSTLAALTHLLAQPSLTLERLVEGSAEIVSTMLAAHVCLSIVDLGTGREIARAEQGPPGAAPQANPSIALPAHDPERHAGHALNVALVPSSSHGHTGSLRVWRSPEAPPFSAEEARTVPLAADQISIALGNVLAGHSLDLTLRELRELSLQTARALVRAVEMRDRYTAGHSARVSRYAVALARALGIDEAEVETLRVAALLHDVGKIGISDLLLNKPGPLTPAERQRIEEHPAMGCQIIAGVQSLAPALPLILHHQERYDGLGYPRQLAREQIPLCARILAVADSFEAMTATRAYREGRTVGEALQILSAGSGQQWDPVVVAAWQQIVARVLTPDSSGDR
ncbi:MAG: HD domain-containing protein, partial [Anaerolineae bacterium]|nr:HD domain-containing protein [Anaerolineae bacterium]